MGLGVAIPSSTSVSVLITQAFRSARLNARQGLAMLLGADIGITTLVLLTSLHIEKAAPYQSGFPDRREGEYGGTHWPDR